ncbi:MAG: C_GCAxxG_C_C family protein [Bacteroidales bacterium]|nr:C_GCAxxG_C_C family protein [Bacteroidales bacterium]
MDRSELALEKKHALGLNCCQAVLLAFAPEIQNSTEDYLLALGSGFGSGMGCGDATCGALVGAGMVAGLLNTPGSSPDDEETRKVPTTMITRGFCQKFKEQAGALRCSDIKGLQTDPSTGKVIRGKVLCSCDDCVRHAIHLAESLLR